MSEFESPEMLEAMDALDRKDFSSAGRLFTRIAESGNPKALCNLATFYHTGWGVKADPRKAVELYLRIAELEIREEHLSGIAFNNLASIYSCGLGDVEPDLEKAIEYRTRARALGFEM